MGQLVRLGGRYDDEGRDAPQLVSECARQRRRGALARHRHEPLEPWVAVDADDPDARELAQAWARGWETSGAVLTAVGRGALAGEQEEPISSCPYDCLSADEDEQFLAWHWLHGWHQRGGRLENDDLAEVVVLRPASAAGPHSRHA